MLIGNIGFGSWQHSTLFYPKIREKHEKSRQLAKKSREIAYVVAKAGLRSLGCCTTKSSLLDYEVEAAALRSPASFTWHITAPQFEPSRHFARHSLSLNLDSPPGSPSLRGGRYRHFLPCIDHLRAKNAATTTKDLFPKSNYYSESADSSAISHQPSPALPGKS